MKKIILLILISIIKINAQTIDASLIQLNFIGDSNPKYLTSDLNQIFFSADDGVHGRELWLFNTINNTSNLVKDIYPGTQYGIDNSKFEIIDHILYFIANDGVNGNELWRSDGTEIGTYMIKNINPNGDSLTDFIVYDGKLYFSAFENNDNEVWVSDGTLNGTNLLKNINTNSSSTPEDFFIFNNNLYFVADNGINGYELWKSDGTIAGTNLFKDINPNGNGVINGNNFITFDNNFYFFANNGVNGYELWKSDGTSNGTILLKDIIPGVSFYNTNISGASTTNYFVFKAYTPSTGYELWVSDGTSIGTNILKDINPQYNGINNTKFINFNNSIFFSADDNVNGEELWVTNGTTLGTQILKDIKLGNNSSNITELTSTSNFIIFSAQGDLNTFNTLWRSDGTQGGTFELKNVNLDISSSSMEVNFVILNGLLYFQGGSNSSNGRELWKTDGTTINTNIALDINHKFSCYVNRSDSEELNGKLIFLGNDGSHGTEPFVSDGTINGSKILKDINVGNLNSFFNSDTNTKLDIFTKAGNLVYFRANNGLNGYELYKTDGTEINTQMVKDISIGTASSLVESTLFMSFNNVIYFKANDQIHGEELWRSDGTESGTYILKDINPGIGSAFDGISNVYLETNNILNEKCYAVLNGYLYFFAYDGINRAIWRTDGTNAGTIKIITIPSSGGYDNDRKIINSNNEKIFFKTNTTNSSFGNNTLWVTDGTQANTTQLYFTPNTSVQQFKKNIIFNNELYFTSINLNGYSLYKTNGTTTGTILLKDGVPSNKTFNYLKPCGNFVYFTIGFQSDNSGTELWRTNGTNSGTNLINETGINNPLDVYLDCTCIQNNLFFLKQNYSNKIWHINDNLLLPDFNMINVTNSDNFSTSEGAVELFPFNNNLMFAGYSFLNGTELYYSNITNLLNSNYNEFNDNLKIKIYPNPTSNIINIITNEGKVIENIEIYNIIGEKVNFNKSTSDNKTIDLSNLEKGVYIIKIKTDGKYSFQKIIVN